MTQTIKLNNLSAVLLTLLVISLLYVGIGGHSVNQQVPKSQTADPAKTCDPLQAQITSAEMNYTLTVDNTTYDIAVDPVNAKLWVNNKMENQSYYDTVVQLLLTYPFYNITYLQLQLNQLLVTGRIHGGCIVFPDSVEYHLQLDQTILEFQISREIDQLLKWVYENFNSNLNFTMFSLELN